MNYNKINTQDDAIEQKEDPTLDTPHDSEVQAPPPVPEQEIEDEIEETDDLHTEVQVDHASRIASTPEKHHQQQSSVTQLQASENAALRPVPEGELPRLDDAIPVLIKEGEDRGQLLQKNLERGTRYSDLQDYWGTVLTGSIDTIPEPIRQAAGAQDKNLNPEERDEQILRTVNQSWAADNLGKPRHEVKEKWEEIREALSEDRLISADEEELFYALSDDQEKTKVQDMAYDLYDKGFQQGLTADSPEAWRRYVQKEKEKVDPSKHACIDEYAKKSYELGAEMRKKYLPMAQTLSEGIEMMVSSEHRMFSPEQIVDSAGSARSAGSQLRKLTKDQRQIVYHLCLQERQKMQKGQTDEDLATQLWRSAKRGGQNIGFNLGLGAMHLGSAAMDSIGSVVDESLGTDLQSSAENVDLRARVAHEIRNLAQQQVAPLYIPENTPLAEQFLIDMTGVVPAATMGFGGALAWGSLIGSGVGSSVSEARERNAEGDIAVQNAAGIVAAGIQEGISFAFTRVGGRVFEKSLGQFMKAKGKGVRGYSLAALRSGGIASAETLKMALEQKAGNLSDLGLHELASQIDKTNSNINWESYGKNFGDIELNMREAAMNLPYLLIGAGRAKLQHFEQARALKNSPNILETWGIAQQDIDIIMKEEKLPLANDLLQDALLKSSSWSGMEFLEKAKLSLQLLNSDYFQDFKDDDTVIDFLKLPASIKQIPAMSLSDEAPSGKPDIEKLQAKHGPIKGSNLRLGKALQFWDYMWERSNLDRLLPQSMQRSSAGVRLHYIHRILQDRHDERLQRHLSGQPAVPLSLYRGFFNPHAEKERRLMVADQAASLRDLSYQLLLNTYPLDFLLRDSSSFSGLVKKREKLRRYHVNRVASEVIHRALGRTQKDSEKSLRWQMNEFYRHYRAYAVTGLWARKVDKGAFSHLEKYALHGPEKRAESKYSAEFYQAAHTLFAMERSTEFFYEMIPQLDDYQRLIAMGKTSAQAYSEIISRELEVDVKEFPEYPLKLIEKDAQSTDFTALDTLHQEKLTRYTKISGRQLEKAEGVDGGSFYRTTLPDGSYTRWHETEQMAVRDLVMSTASIFRPLGENVHAVIADKKNPNLTGYLSDENSQYSPFEIISAQAFSDLYQHHVMAIASGMPSLEYKRMKQRVGMNHSADFLNFTPVDESTSHLKKYSINELSTTTPYSLLRARSHAYWKNQFNLKNINIQKTAHHLVSLKAITPDQVTQLLHTPSPDYNMKEVPRHNETLKTIYPSHKNNFSLTQKRREDLATILADLSMDYLVATSDQHALPKSFKTWLNLVPLCPPEPRKDTPEKVPLGKNWENILRWSNRQTATNLQNRAERYDEIRHDPSPIENSHLMPLILSSLGLNESHNYERAWNHYYSGDHIIYTQDDALGQLVLTPSEMWKNMTPSNQDWLYNQLFESYGNSSSRGDMYSSKKSLTKALRILDDTLQDYPDLHRMNLSPLSNNRLITLALEDINEYPSMIEEAQFEPIPWNIPTDVHLGYRYDKEIELPDYLADDERVLPSLKLLLDLRQLSAKRAVLSDMGIIWDRKIYGADHNLLPEMEDHWVAERPLESLLPIIDDIQSRIKDNGGKFYKYMDIAFKPISEQLDLSPLQHAVIYRDGHFPTHTIRLMPGDAKASDNTARAPYYCEVRSGVYFHKNRHLPNPSDEYSDPIYTSLNHYTPYEIKQHNKARHASTSKSTISHHINRVISELRDPDIQSRIEQGDPVAEELLIPLFEDTGLAYDLTTKTLDDLTTGQLTLLKICYDLSRLAYGADKETAYKDLLNFTSKIKNKPGGVKKLALNLFDMLERQNKQSLETREKAIRDGLIEDKNKPGRRPELRDFRNLKKKYEQGAFWYDLGI